MIKKSIKVKLFGISCLKCVFAIIAYILLFIILILEIIFYSVTIGKIKTKWTEHFSNWCINITKIFLKKEFALITGKTEYSALQIVSQETAKELNKLQNRIGFGVSEGVKFDSDKKGTSNEC